MSGYSVPASIRALPVGTAGASPAYSGIKTSPGVRSLPIAAPLPASQFGKASPPPATLLVNARTPFTQAAVSTAVISGVKTARGVKVAVKVARGAVVGAMQPGSTANEPAQGPAIPRIKTRI
jgi:hypothetical protein